MHNKFKRKMFKARKRKTVYIIKKIVKDLDKFVLFLVTHYDFVSLINTALIKLKR